MQMLTTQNAYEKLFKTTRKDRNTETDGEMKIQLNKAKVVYKAVHAEAQHYIAFHKIAVYIAVQNEADQGT